MFKWTKSLETGNQEIDRQHMGLFDMINLLETKKSPEDILKTFEFLEEYIKFHFSTEERLMILSKYSKFSEHRNIHILLVHSFLSYKEQFAAGNLDVTQLHVFLSGWLEQHIKIMDKRMIAEICGQSEIEVSSED